MVGLFSSNSENQGLEAEKQRLEERIESGKASGNDRFVSIGQELLDNFEDYGNDFYHGTRGESAEKIMKVGIRGSPEDTRLTGETGTQSEASLTYLPAWALHYSLDQDPNTVDTVTDFVNRNYGAGIEERDGLVDFVESLKDPEDLEDRGASYNSKILKGLKEDTRGFENLSDEIPEDGIQAHEVVFGTDYDAIKDQIDIGRPPTRDEIEALETEEYSSLGEVKVSEVPRDELTAYVPHEFLQSYREEHSDNEMDVKSYDALMLKHELEMEDTYREKGIRNFEGFWKEERLGVANRTEDWNPTPDQIDISY
ncbi:MAG: hypothetical protein ABEJ87_00495 [Candidatus Nanohalobium sp.]